SVRLIWRQWRVIARYLLIWQSLQCIGFALEIWTALWALHVDASFSTAIAIEVLVQLISSLAFFVPANLGVQEGSFVLIGGMFGLDAPTCLALAGARRLRDLLFYVPGLIYWQFEQRSLIPRCVDASGSQR
ncbi:lysylphosphatidylglycerol synthase domain-containing protein, partial [Caballeronia sp. BR00000012568055]|uniref:lysylphosphatidylglycerol synthase domain-containing protein n=1 Tax=Caballeronia sp. BR00000012568055 TaxID=2918761 RepID=UPI0034D5F84F